MKQRNREKNSPSRPPLQSHLFSQSLGFHFEELMGDVERERKRVLLRDGPPSLQFYYSRGPALTHPGYHYAFQIPTSRFLRAHRGGRDTIKAGC